jgi:hypothetical protein
MTMFDAAQKVQVKPGWLSYCIHRNHRCGGLRWVREGQPWRGVGECGRRAAMVRCVERPDLPPFESILEAANWAGVSRSSVSWSINAGYSSGGYHFYRTDKPIPEPKRHHEKPVRDRQTGEVFPNVAEAARSRVGPAGDKAKDRRRMKSMCMAIIRDIAKWTGRYERVESQRTCAA